MQRKITTNFFVTTGVCVCLFAGSSLLAQQTNGLAGTNVLAISEQTQLPAFIDFEAGKGISKVNLRPGRMQH